MIVKDIFSFFKNNKLFSKTLFLIATGDLKAAKYRIDTRTKER